MWQLPPQDKVGKIAGDFEHAWGKELAKPIPSLVRSPAPSAGEVVPAQ